MFFTNASRYARIEENTCSNGGGRMALTEEIYEKLKILTDAAKYDVACTSSGSDRGGKRGMMGNTVSSGICHCFAADGRCISLLKILQSNECVFDCKYCQNRVTRDVPRASFTPEEIAELTISFYRRNYIEGLFLSSGIWKNPDFAMEQIYRTVVLLRTRWGFNGYIHVKAIPGADLGLVERTGWYVDRMSINMELPTAQSLSMLAPQKNREKIVRPMYLIQQGRKENRWDALPGQEHVGRLPGGEKRERFFVPAVQKKKGRVFVPAGQSTQMIIGATPETDYEIVHMAETMYRQFDLKRVFYSAFINTTGDSLLPDTTESGPPLLREHRLYQADFLLRYYQFRADEIVSREHPSLNIQVDPKCSWALSHMEYFPVEVSTADYHTLLRIPGVGVKSARRIVAARRLGRLDYPSLKKFGVVLKRAMYFITCEGKMMMQIRQDPRFILTNLLGLDEKLPPGITDGTSYRQLSLEDMAELTIEQIGGGI